MCFSPCSPVPSAKAPRSSTSPTTSNAPRDKLATDEVSNPPQKTLESKISNSCTDNPILGHSLLAPLSIQTELKTDIPSVNIIPSSPIPARHQVSLSPGADKAENVEDGTNEELKLINTLEQYIQRKRSATNNLDSNVEDASTDPKDGVKQSQSNFVDPGPMIMKIEHIDDHNIGASKLKATEKFPVVTRRFRQLPNQISKETVDDASEQAQKLSSAQLNVAPVLDLKCETSKNIMKTNASNEEAPEQSTVNANADDHP